MIGLSLLGGCVSLAFFALLDPAWRLIMLRAKAGKEAGERVLELVVTPA